MSKILELKELNRIQIKKILDEIVFTVKFSTRIYSNDCRNYRVEMFERDQSVFLRGTKQTRVTRNQTAPKSM